MTAPSEATYVIDDRQWIVETPDVRVQILTLGSGQEVPWHSQSAVTDTFTVPPKPPHQVAGKDGGPCRFLVVQGVGKYDFVPFDAPG